MLNQRFAELATVARQRRFPDADKQKDGRASYAIITLISAQLVPCTGQSCAENVKCNHFNLVERLHESRKGG